MNPIQTQSHVVITGATSGIGLQLTKDYLASGAKVTGIGRNNDALAELRELGAQTLELDVTDYEAVMEAFKHIGDIDSLMH